MDEMLIDPNTKLPLLPEGYRFFVRRSGEYNAIENHYAVFLEKLSDKKKISWFKWGYVWEPVVMIKIWNPNERNADGSLPPMVLTRKKIYDAACSAYYEWQRGVKKQKENEESNLRRQAREAEKRLFGAYPPKSL